MNSLALMSMLLVAIPPSDAASRHAMEAVLPRVYIPRGHSRWKDYRKGCVEAEPIPPKTARQLKKEEKYRKMGLTNKLSATPKKVEVVKSEQSETIGWNESDLNSSPHGAD